MAKYIARCQLTLHDNLYYASHELGRFYETEKYLHNYGLTYALGLVRPAPAYFNGSQVPRYQTELTPARLGSYYVTPAHPIRVDFSFVTFKMATVPYYAKSEPESGNRILYGRAKEIAPESYFEFFVFADEQGQLPHWIRLGKWMAKAELKYKWYEIGKEKSLAQRHEPSTVQIVDCPLNPLDIKRNRLYAYDVITMPPVSLLSNVSVNGPCCKLGSDEFFNDPKDKVKFVPLNMGYFGAD